MIYSTLLVAAFAVGTEARSLWSPKPATYGAPTSDEFIIKTTYPLGNGRLGAMPFGDPGKEKLILNIDSLWSGGPFEAANYTGGNPSSAVSGALPGIRDWIWKHGSGNVSELLGSGANYGSYHVLANLSVAIDHGSEYTNYRRELDLEKGTHETKYTVDGAEYQTSAFCSYPDQVCMYRVVSSKPLPNLTVNFENIQVDKSLINATCENKWARFTGVTQLGPPTGMKFDAIARVSGRAKSACDGGHLKVTPAKGQRSVTIVVGAGTDFDQDKGTAENKYSFKGADPAEHVTDVTTKAAFACYKDILSRHTKDYQALFGAFKLNIPDTKGSAKKPTAELVQAYSVKSDGDPYLEGLIFDFSRYLLITSSRDNSLPANLQGRWAEANNPAWSADYHANINLQMNYWVADQTGLAKTQPGLWDYMEKNWAPRGSETAKLLYDAKGWTVHNEMNIFGHTGMKEGATYADYPAAPAWMMQHVWDNFEYTQDVAWLKRQGYPLIKAIAEFWLTQLQEDKFFNDGTLVVNPCNSPEQGPTTFGCAHFQQLIFQVFEAVLTAAPLVSESDKEFLKDVQKSLDSLDTGVHFTEWGGMKEWKVPDSYGFDTKNDHRHLSHLVGWHPGYSVSSFSNGYTNHSIQSAVEQTLIARGPGKGGDANAGWEKVWRAACWARLNNTEQAHFELRFAIDENFANNLFSMYDELNQPFQIDANFGFGGAVLAMLVVDLPVRSNHKGERVVTLGPAIPKTWGQGSVEGLRLRGGKSVDFSWDANGKVTKASLNGNESGNEVKLVNSAGEVL